MSIKALHTSVSVSNELRLESEARNLSGIIVSKLVLEKVANN
jgi:hypothetical protein